MWWGFIVNLVFVYPVIEMVEEWRLRRSAEKEPRGNAEAGSIRPPTGRHVRPMGN
jgi:hypothetical protein